MRSTVPFSLFRLKSSRLKPSRLKGDEATALTEFVLVAPLFVLLIFWSQFFADLGLVRIKADEAARYALWETTAQREPAIINEEVSARFANLASPESIRQPRPVGVRSFPNANFTSNIRENVEARMDARITMPPAPGGILGTILSFAMPLINQAVSSMFNRYGFNQNGASQANVTVGVRNTIFPAGRVLGIFFDAGQGSGTITVRSRTPNMVVDTWKAWPGRYRTLPGSSRNVATDVYDTYPRTSANANSAVEREVQAQVARGAFWGQSGGIVGGIANFIDELAGPNIVSTRTWAESGWKNAGPIAILPADQPRASFSPGYNVANQRMGGGREVSGSRGWANGINVAYPRNTVDGNTFGGGPTVDRSRFTVPYRVNTGIWNQMGGATNTGGMAVSPIPGINTPNLNPYVRAMNCRDIYYMGSRIPQITSYEENHFLRAYPGCF